MSVASMNEDDERRYSALLSLLIDARSFDIGMLDAFLNQYKRSTLSCTASDVRIVVKVAIRNGDIEKFRKPGDREEVCVRLTAKGKITAERCRNEWLS